MGDENVTIRFTPLSGGHSLAPPCYLLELGGMRVLLDAGWCEPFDEELLRPLLRLLPDVDAVLISHGNLEHMGALAYAMERGLSCPVYCTVPAKTMGHLAMYDAYLSKHHSGNFSLFTPDSIDAAWERVVPLKFSQHVVLEPSRPGAAVAAGVEITPYLAGHTLGGAFWRIKVGMDEIIYCSQYNFANEQHLDKGAMGSLQRPMLLICGSSNALTVHTDKRGDRDRMLRERVTATLRAGGNTLIPVDAAGRVLEIAMVLDAWWQKVRPTGSLVMLSTQAFNVAVAAASLSEFMANKVSQQFQAAADFALLPTVHRCHSIEDLQRTPRPWVVLASQADLESGFSRELLAAWAGDANNSVVLVERGLPKSLAAALAAGERGPMVLRLAERKLLRGEELAEFSRNREIARLQELERQRNARSQQEQKEAMDDFDGREENLSAVTTLFVPDNPYFRDETQFDLVPSELGPGAPPPMFPFVRGASDASRQDNVGDWSPYGTVFDVSMFDPESKKKAAAAAAAASAAASAKAEKEAPVEEAPSKIEVAEINLNILCNVSYLDFEGKSDGRALRHAVQMLMPRSAIFVRGEAAHLDEMKRFVLVCQEKKKVFLFLTRQTKSELQLQRVHLPDVGQTVDASSEAQMYAAWLQDLLRATLKWQVLDDYEVAYVSSRVEAVEVQDKQERRVLGVAGEDETEESTHRTVFVGQPALKDVKHVLDKMGFACEFQQGTLVVNDVVTVRKELVSGSAVLRVEGAFCPDLFEVRNVVYGQLKML